MQIDRTEADVMETYKEVLADLHEQPSKCRWKVTRSNQVEGRKRSRTENSDTDNEIIPTGANTGR